MKKETPKKVRAVNITPEVKKTPSKPPKKSGLSKSDPDYYRKIGIISAQKRKMTSEQFSAMARLSHGENSKRDGYHGGRKKKDDSSQEQ